jgi:hypothetical protein
MLVVIAALLIGVVLGGCLLESLSASPPADPSPPYGSAAVLADDLMARAAAWGVSAVELVPTRDSAICRTEIDGTVADVGTTIGRCAAIGVAREFATRADGRPFPHRLVAQTEAGRVPLTIDLRRNAYGWVISLRRELRDDAAPPPFTYTRSTRPAVAMRGVV